VLQLGSTRIVGGGKPRCSGAGGGQQRGPGLPSVACDFTELDDVTNAASEFTSLYVDRLQILCAQIDPGHLTANDLVDRDGFTVSVPSAGDYVLKVVAAGSSYKDGDTFSFQTSALTTQVTVRVDWTGGTAELDYALFPAGSTTPAFFSGDANSSLELSVFAVQPSTIYWLWLAAKGTSRGLPVGYDISLCGDSFAFSP